MRSRGFVRVMSPGLPPWPKLYFNRQKNIAFVSARHATWRSHEWAIRTAAGIAWLVICMAVPVIWVAIPVEHTLLKTIIVLTASITILPILQWATPRAMRRFLAWHIFATRTSLWATPTIMAFKSRLHTRPIVICRIWKGLSVHGKFIVNQDLEAARHAADEQKRNHLPVSHLNEAMIVEIVISATNPENPILTHDRKTLQRTVPVMELSALQATKFTMVFAAALMITQANTAINRRSNNGADIDA